MSRSKKILGSVFIALLIACLLLSVVGIGYYTDGFTNFSKDNSVNQVNSSEGMINTALVENGLELSVQEINKVAFAENAIDENADSAYSLIAIINPTNATFPELDWSIRFNNPSSNWATGKNIEDFVSLSVKQDGGPEAVVACLQPFGEQIIIDVQSRAYSGVSASCTLDFARRIEDIALSDDSGNYSEANNVYVNFEFPKFEEFKSFNFKEINYGFLWLDGVLGSEKDYSIFDTDIEKNVTFSDYTIKDNQLVFDQDNVPDLAGQSTIETKVNSNFSDLLSSHHKFIFDSIINLEYFLGEHYNSCSNPMNWILHSSPSLPTNFNNETYMALMSDVVEWVHNNPDLPIFTRTIKIKGKYSSYEKTFNFYYKPETVVIPVFDVSLANSEMVL